MKFDKYENIGAYHWAECNKKSPGYLYNPALEARYMIVVKKVFRQDKALEVGCGDGYLIGLLSKYFFEVYGIEAEKTAVDLAVKMLSGKNNCKVKQGDCYELDFSDGMFDTVFMADVIEHLTDPKIALSEIARVLKSDGTLFVTTPKWRSGRMSDVFHVKEYTPDELNQMLNEYFSEVQLSYFWPSFWFRLYETKIGWRIIKIISRYLFNPLLGEGLDPEKFDQILAVCRNPNKRSFVTTT